MTIKDVIKGIQITADLEKPFHFRQDAHTITKINNKLRTEHSEEMKRMTEHITNMISEIALLNTEININFNNLVKVHLIDLDELRLKQDKMRNDFHMSRD